jgi:hypothetical protein
MTLKNDSIYIGLVILVLLVIVVSTVLMAFNCRKRCGRIVIWRILLSLVLSLLVLKEVGGVTYDPNYPLFSFAGWVGMWLAAVCAIWFAWLRPKKMRLSCKADSQENTE